MSCDNCGLRTPRPRLCKQCAMDKRHESFGSDEVEPDENTVELLAFECGECGCDFELEAQTRKECPECGYIGLIGYGSREVLTV